MHTPRYPTISPIQARREGYKLLTTDYNTEDGDAWMLDRVIADMKRGDADYRLVEHRPGMISVARHESEFVRDRAHDLMTKAL